MNKDIINIKGPDGYHINGDKEIKNIVVKLMKRDSLIKCQIQLNEQKKIQNGFNIYDSVLDVEQGGYAVSYGDDFLFTYGIDPCCGVVLCDGQKSILFHLDGRTEPEKVKKVTDSIGFNSDAKVLIFPGVTCGYEGTFRYAELEKIYTNNGNDTTVCRINGTFGYVSVSGNEIRAGSALFKENEMYFLGQEKTKK